MAFEDIKVEGVDLKPLAQGRGIVGVATPALLIKQMWYAESFVQKDKKRWVRKSGSVSMKRFARNLLLKKDETAVAWFDNKSGLNNQERSDKNISRIASERQATKSSRKKVKNGKTTKVEVVVSK